jgi:NAD(P) transhydrogenase subunit alpha
MKIAVARETYPGEQRVALVPAALTKLLKVGAEVFVERGAGQLAGYTDQQYEDKGAKLVDSREQAYAQAEIIFQVRSLGANPEAGKDDLPLFNADKFVVGMCDPLGNPQAIQDVAATGATQFALEMIPRITRAQSMDVLSSMANLAGYRAVLLGAIELPKMFPMMMTAAGTIKPARVFVIGAGVAGLQAIATAKRLGSVVHAYDVRPAVREQCESLGAKFVELELETSGAEDKGGYAKAQGEEFYVKQRELMASVVAESDVVITTAAIPGRQSPLLITKEAVAGMAPSSVIIDMAAERGGNCELSQADERVVENDVVILGPTNLPSEVPYHASQMYANNLVNFLLNMVKDNELVVDTADEITAGTLVAQNNDVVSSRIREILDLEPLEVPSEPEPEAADPNATIKLDEDEETSDDTPKSTND